MPGFLQDLTFIFEVTILNLFLWNFQKFLFFTAWVFSCFLQTPWKVSCVLHWGEASIFPLSHKVQISGRLQWWFPLWVSTQNLWSFNLLLRHIKHLSWDQCFQKKLHKVPSSLIYIHKNFVCDRKKWVCNSTIELRRPWGRGSRLLPGNSQSQRWPPASASHFHTLVCREQAARTVGLFGAAVAAHEALDIRRYQRFILGREQPALPRVIIYRWPVKLQFSVNSWSKKE